jgi:ribonuclease T2
MALVLRLARLAVFLAGALAAVRGESLAQPREGRAPGDFAFYMLSLSITPSFCAMSPRNGELPECRQGSDAAYRAAPLSVHGLWPNKERVSVNMQPQFCAATPLGPLPPELAQQLRRVMPGMESGLERHEWSRHGTCSGLAPDAYFSTIVRLADRANATVGAALRDAGMLGQQVRIDDLLAAVAGKDPAIAPAVVVYGRLARGAEQRAYIEEIRLALAKDFTPEPVESVGMRHNSGCPGGAGFLPAGFAGR